MWREVSGGYDDSIILSSILLDLHIIDRLCGRRLLICFRINRAYFDMELALLDILAVQNGRLVEQISR